MAQRQSVTSVEISPDLERRSRFLKYTIAMVIRVICILLAVVLPYFAVIIANEGSSKNPDKAPKLEAPTLSISADAFRQTNKDDQ
jgi:cytoskeletal protein RodZ